MYFGGQGGVEGLVVGLALPVGCNFFNNALGVFGRDGGRRGFAGGQIAHRNIKKVAVQFGVQNAVTAIAASAAKQQLVFLHVHGHVFRNVHEGLGPAQHQGLTVRFLHGLGEVQCAFNVDARLLAFKAFQQLEHAGVGFAELVFPALDLVIQTLFLRGAAFASGGAHYGTPEKWICGVRGVCTAAARRTPKGGGNPRLQTPVHGLCQNYKYLKYWIIFYSCAGGACKGNLWGGNDAKLHHLGLAFDKINYACDANLHHA